MRIDEVKSLLHGSGAKPRHATLMLRAWARGLPLDAFAHLADFPARLRAALPALDATLRALVSPRSEHASNDGSVRLLLALRDGQSLESVLLPGDGLCVSTQVGCAVGCVFCMTGREGLKRQLGAAEIVAQVVLARERRRVRRVVLMGMGEPAHNLDEVLDALDLLGGEGGLDSKNLVFSTVGDRRAFERLPLRAVKPALAVSLHTTKPELRARLLPRAPRIEPAELVELAETYARATGHPIQYQWTLLDGVNDGDDEVERLGELLAGKYAVVNFIPFNALDAPGAGARLARPPAARAEAIAKALYRRGVLAKLRRSAGQDVQAGCGQLRARTLTA
jgi:23S rRNA (adenine2503-C2)-methyltransferase